MNMIPRRGHIGLSGQDQEDYNLWVVTVGLLGLVIVDLLTVSDFNIVVFRAGKTLVDNVYACSFDLCSALWAMSISFGW